MFSTEEKGTNTVDIMQDSFETVELGEDGQFTRESVVLFYYSEGIGPILLTFFYTFGQIHKRVIKHRNNALTETFVCLHVWTPHPNMLKGLNSGRLN